MAGLADFGFSSGITLATQFSIGILSAGEEMNALKEAIKIIEFTRCKVVKSLTILGPNVSKDDRETADRLLRTAHTVLGRLSKSSEKDTLWKRAKWHVWTKDRVQDDKFTASLLHDAMLSLKESLKKSEEKMFFTMRSNRRKVDAEALEDILSLMLSGLVQNMNSGNRPRITDEIAAGSNGV